MTDQAASKVPELQPEAWDLGESGPGARRLRHALARIFQTGGGGGSFFPVASPHCQSANLGKKFRTERNPKGSNP
jgi:hypothetical protein